MPSFTPNEKAEAEYMEKLVTLRDKAIPIVKMSIYPGAGIVADAIDKAIDEIPTLTKGHYWGTPENPIDGLTKFQKKGLHDGFGLSVMSNNSGFINVKPGFDGYNSTTSVTAKKNRWKTTKQANIMIARSVESGTSFRKKHPFVGPASRRVKNKAVQKISDELDKNIEAVMEK